MKLFVVCMLVAVAQLHAKSYGQKLTLHAVQQPLDKVVAEISKQTGYKFLYRKKLIQELGPINAQVQNMDVEPALNLIFKGLPVKMVVVNKTVALDWKPLPIAALNAQPPIDVKGRILNELGEPVVASIIVKGSSKGVSSNELGYFELKGVEPTATLQIAGIGIESFEISLQNRNSLSLVAKVKRSQTENVTISTGYQQLPKERSTGSFTVVNNAELNRRVSTNVLSRLEGITSGLAFYRNSKTDQPTLNIRGRSTIFANTSPLIILDNFPYDGDINSINPNDIENITILKDAAAASIYGVRAANGVIVITSKKGSISQTPRVSFNTAYTLTERPDLHYFPRMNARDFIEMEKDFFGRGWYAAQEASTVKVPLTPVVEILIKKRDGLLSAAAADDAIAAISQTDWMSDYERYFFRKGSLVQNSVSISGGSERSRYYFSLGHDRDLSNLNRNSTKRYTVNGSNVYTPVARLDISTSLMYTSTQSMLNNAGINDFAISSGRRYYPYARMIDADGNALATTVNYRENYKQQREAISGISWAFRPLDELNLANNTASQHYVRFIGGLKYTFFRSLSIEAKYQYEKQLRRTDNLLSQDMYVVRNMMNQFYNAAGTIKSPVPAGSILDLGNSELESKLARAQANYSTAVGRHAISALAAFEVRELGTNSNQNRMYGYDPATLSSQAVDYTTRFPTNPLGSLQSIANPRTLTSTTDRYLSYLANASYTYDRRYNVSVSGRIDNTNYFGLEANQRAVPLWSAGFKWNITNESFFHVPAFSMLALRATYGFNGNINKDLTAYTTVRYGSDQITLLPNATLVNPPNPDLRWEKIGMANFGLDFSFKKIASGSLEYFMKKGVDLIGDAATDPTTGITSLRGNLSSIKGRGLDLVLNLDWFKKDFSWTTGILFNYATDKVYDYTRIISTGSVIQNGSGDGLSLAPQIGRPVLSVYSYRWGGLDPQTGDPMGVLDGKVTKVYADLFTKTTHAELVYNGPANPPVFGAIRNDFAYKMLALSFNITYKMGHYFRRPSVDYGLMLNFWYGNTDYLRRWRKPGDEAFTNIPAPPANSPTQGSTRDALFYANVETLVEKADHIRFQDISLSYDLAGGKKLAMFRTLRVYGYVNNLGILWRANDYHIDPDAIPDSGSRFLPLARSYSLGIKADF